MVGFQEMTGQVEVTDGIQVQVFRKKPQILLDCPELIASAHICLDGFGVIGIQQCFGLQSECHFFKPIDESNKLQFIKWPGQKVVFGLYGLQLFGFEVIAPGMGEEVIEQGLIFFGFVVEDIEGKQFVELFDVVEQLMKNEVTLLQSLDALLAFLKDLQELLIDLFATFMGETIFRIEVGVTIGLAPKGDYELGQSILFLDLVGHSFKLDWFLGCHLCLCLPIRKLYLRLCIISLYYFSNRIFLGWSNVDQDLGFISDHYFWIYILGLADICR